TNRLLALARAAATRPDERETDALIASGEQVTAALTALALQDAGVPAQSFLGHQIRIETDTAHGRARIRRIDVDGLRETVGGGRVAVVAGFQGVCENGSITTLGRGGADTSGGALAAAPRAGVCELHPHGPAPRPRPAQARAHRLRRDARAREPRREGVADPVGRVREALQRPGAR